MRNDRAAVRLCVGLLAAWLLADGNAMAQNRVELKPESTAESSQPSQFTIEAWPAPAPSSTVKVLEAPRTAAQPASVRTPSTSPLPTTERPQDANIQAPGLRWQGGPTLAAPAPDRSMILDAPSSALTGRALMQQNRQPLSIAQAVLPELEMPSEVTAEPPVLYMPQPYGGVRSGEMQGGDGLDDDYHTALRYLKCNMPIACLEVLRCSSSATPDIMYSKELVMGLAFGQLNLLEEARCLYFRVLNESQNPLLLKLAQKYLNDIDCGAREP